jgi:hypothetical protein
MHSLRADYPKHPDTTVITKSESIIGKSFQEKDIWNYYEGIKNKIIPVLKDQNLFVRLKTDSGPIYVRHPFFGNTEFIRINNEKNFNKYNNGRVIEFHQTMENSCPFYVVDFDAVGDWNKTKKITAEIADGLDKLPEGRKVEIRYTGKRGFHVLLWLKKTKPIDQAREDLKTWLKEAFGDRDDLVVGESPIGSKSALGVSPMKLNGGQVAKWSLRVTGLCCIEVPRTKLMSFRKEDATLEKTFKQLNGKNFMSIEKKVMAGRVLKAFLELNAGTFPNVEDIYKTRRTLIQPKQPAKPANPEEPFAKPGEMVWVLDNHGNFTKIPWNSKLEKVRKTAGVSMVTCSNCRESFEWSGQPEVAMGSVKCPSCGKPVDQEGNAYAS